LLTANISQAEQANKTCRPDHDIKIGDRVKLSTAHRHIEYLKMGEKRVAQYMCRFDGPYTVTATHPECSTYTLSLPNQPNVFPVFHSSEIEPYVENDDKLFPGRKLAEPAPIINDNGDEEWFIDEIIDERPRGRGKQYLVTFSGYGPARSSHYVRLTVSSRSAYRPHPNI
jgi:hypothetical protein